MDEFAKLKEKIDHEAADFLELELSAPRVELTNAIRWHDLTVSNVHCSQCLLRWRFLPEVKLLRTSGVKEAKQRYTC